MAAQEDKDETEADSGGEGVPRKFPPTGEGYCQHCHMIVGTYRRKLIQHAGAYARWIGGADARLEQKRSTILVEWCMGSGLKPFPMPENTIDPWEKDQ